MNFFGLSLLPTSVVTKLIEDKCAAEGALMVLTASLAREEEVKYLQEKVHQHASHFEVVEARIDKNHEREMSRLSVQEVFVRDHNNRLREIEKSLKQPRKK